MLRDRKRRCARRDGLRAPASPLACSTRSSGIATATLSRPIHRARHVRRYWAGPHRDRRAGDSRHASKGRASPRRPEPGRGGAARVDRLGQSQNLEGHQAGAALGGKQRRPHGAQVHHMPAMHVNNEFGTLDVFHNGVIPDHMGSPQYRLRSIGWAEGMLGLYESAGRMGIGACGGAIWPRLDTAASRRDGGGAVSGGRPRAQIHMPEWFPMCGDGGSSLCVEVAEMAAREYERRAARSGGWPTATRA